MKEPEGLPDWFFDKTDHRRIVYGYLSSCGMDNLVKKSQEHQVEHGHNDYCSLAEFLVSNLL